MHLRALCLCRLFKRALLSLKRLRCESLKELSLSLPLLSPSLALCWIAAGNPPRRSLQNGKPVSKRASNVRRLWLSASQGFKVERLFDPSDVQWTHGSRQRRNNAFFLQGKTTRTSSASCVEPSSKASQKTRLVSRASPRVYAQTCPSPTSLAPSARRSGCRRE